MSNGENLQRLILKHQRRLQILKEKQALTGLETPPSVIIEIEDIENKIEELKEQLPNIGPSSGQTQQTVPAIDQLRSAAQVLDGRIDKLERDFIVPFTNEKHIIDQITYSLAPPYHLIDAPAGYGKTELLKELKRRFEEKEWAVAYVGADEHNTPTKLAADLAQDLRLNLNLENIPDQNLSDVVCADLKNKRGNDITRAGVVLLIDLGKQPPSGLIGFVVNQFIPDMQDCLRTSQFFDTKHNRFRVVLAGRYLATHKQIKETFLPLNILQLSPFTYSDLRDTAREYLTAIAEIAVSQISAHIMHLTEGHPGCMASLLQMYKQGGTPDPDRFIKIRQSQIENLIEPTITQIYKDIPRPLQTITDTLGMFRYLSHFILAQVIQENGLTHYPDEYGLADELTTSYVLRRDSNTALLCNDNHRILALHLRKSGKPAYLAQTFCARYLATTDARIPERWAIETLYQFLQQHAGKIETQKQRAKLQAEFYNHQLPQVLTTLASGRRLQAVRRNLNTLLDGDEEFKFVVNYFLRQSEYNDDPYNKLRKKIEQFFSKQVKVSKNG